MADEARPPVAIRTVRPYATEEAFLAEEGDTFTRTAVTLIGAPTRPRGVVIRFEVTLNTGIPILRGEGRVLSFQAADERGPSSLTLRFTRLDARSKALVDRIALLRESRSSSAPPAPPVATTTVPQPTASSPDAVAFPDSAPTLSTSTPGAPPSSDDMATTAAHRLPAEHRAASRPRRELVAPKERDGLLESLRARAKALSPTQIEAILKRRRS